MVYRFAYRCKVCGRFFKPQTPGDMACGYPRYCYEKLNAEEANRLSSPINRVIDRINNQEEG